MKRLQEIFAGNWAIAPKDYEAFCALLMPCIIRGNLDQAEAQLNKYGVNIYAAFPTNIADRWELDDDTLPENSVAVIVLEGVLLSWETYRLERMIQEVEENPKICGAVLWINGPGGMVDGNEVKMIVSAGQNVLVGKYSGSKVKLDDQEYTIVRQSDILAIIE